jgi:hypothetical protein
MVSNEGQVESQRRCAQKVLEVTLRDILSVDLDQLFCGEISSDTTSLATIYSQYLFPSSYLIVMIDGENKIQMEA